MEDLQPVIMCQNLQRSKNNFNAWKQTKKDTMRPGRLKGKDNNVHIDYLHFLHVHTDHINTNAPSTSYVVAVVLPRW